MGLCKYYPPADTRMGMLLTLAGIHDVAILEFGPMGTANYGDMMLQSYGYTTDILHFSTHMTDTQIALGDFDCLRDAIIAIQEKHSPQAIFVLSSVLAEITGASIQHLCRNMSTDVCKVVLLPSPGIGKADIHGITAAISSLDVFVNEGHQKIPYTYNIVGSIADDYTYSSDVAEIIRLMRRYFKAEAFCVMPWNCSLEKLSNFCHGTIDLVIRSEGLPFATCIREKYGVPYVFGRPCGYEQTTAWLRRIANVTGWELDETLLQEDWQKFSEKQLRLKTHIMRTYHGKPLDLLLFSRYDTAKSVGLFLSSELGIKVNTMCPVSFNDDISISSETSWKAYIDSHPDCLVLGDWSMYAYKPNRASIVAHPAAGRLDIAETRPLLGFTAAGVLVEIIWNLLHNL